MGTATVKVIFVKVQFADVTQDRINIFLAPPEVSGTLTVELTGSATDQILSEMRDGGDQTIPFDIPALMDGEYTKVKATWEVDSRPVDDELAYHIIVLGQWRQSQYNVPTESGCTGSATDVFMLPNIGRCFTGITGTNATLRSDLRARRPSTVPGPRTPTAPSRPGRLELFQSAAFDVAAGSRHG